jgi:hypothetical protein
MNWTEGKLARHTGRSRGKGALLKQKQHFAKVRSKSLIASQHQSPPQFSFLNDRITSHSTGRVDIGGTSSPRQPTILTSALRSHHFQDFRQPEDDSNVLSVLKRKRRALLLQDDWVGIGVQKPYNLHFAPSGPDAPKWERIPSTNRRHLSRFKSIFESQYSKLRRNITPCFAPHDIAVRIGSLKSHSRGETRSPHTTSIRHIHHGNDVTQELCSNALKRHKRPSHRSMDKSEYRRNHTECTCPRSVCPSSSSIVGDACSSPVRQIFTTSPLIFHPIPQRSQPASILRSSSQEYMDLCSTLAQVSGREPAVALSQREGNDAWRDFVRPPDSSQAEPSADCEDALLNKISPGASVKEEYRISEPGKYSMDQGPSATSTNTSFHGHVQSPARKPQNDFIPDISSLNPPRVGKDGQTETYSQQRRYFYNDSRLSDPIRTETLNLGQPGNTPCSKFVEAAGLPVPTVEILPSIPLEADMRLLDGILETSAPDNDPIACRDDGVSCLPNHARVRENINPGENNLWKHFIFADLYGNDEADFVRNDLRKAACDKVPSSCSDVLTEPSNFDTVATKGSVMTADFIESMSHRDIANLSGRTSLDLSTGMVSQPLSAASDVLSTPPAPVFIAGKRNDNSLALAGTTSEIASLTVEPPASVVSVQPQIAPKFLRTHSTALDNDEFAVRLGTTKTSNSHGRLTKRKTSGVSKNKKGGQKGIRAVPDYSGDPIEDFNDDHLMQETRRSLFGALETE